VIYRVIYRKLLKTVSPPVTQIGRFGQRQSLVWLADQRKARWQDDRPKSAHNFEASVGWRLNFAALEQVIEPSNPIPAIAVSLQQQVMLSVVSSSTVILRQ
jgi:hypothetical protein